MTPLVLVHGFMGGSTQWHCILSCFTGKRTLITLDLPGFGANAHLPPLNRIEGFAEWVIAELKAQGVERYHLLGHSMGGMVAQEIARRDSARIERLILYATGPLGVIPGRFETIEQSKARARTDGAEQTARRIAATWFLKREKAPLYPACANIAVQATLPALEAGFDAMQAWSGLDALSKIECETLLLWGDCDRTYSWDQTQLLWSGITGASLAVVPQTAHAVHMEKPAIFSELVGDFLTD
ncbi:MAG: alpha/beta fold hydrolase [Litoreibacter sp.]|nr:alpha/beta fold hydrolase [Litoreibacter sp.]